MIGVPVVKLAPVPKKAGASPDCDPALRVSLRERSRFIEAKLGVLVTRA
jgi:hypothetical protein